MGLPNTFIVGGSKSGTSTLQKILNDHSQIYGLPYESHFFSRHFFNEDISTLSGKTFAHTTSEHKIICDKSVTHVNDKLYLQAIKRYCGDDVKIIFMMRDPIDKFLSWWSFMYSVVMSKYNNDYSTYNKNYYDSVLEEINHNTTFQEFLEFQLERYDFLTEHQPNRMSSMNKIQLGRYDNLIGNIQEVFGDNCFYIVTEDFKKNRSKVLRDLFRYLGVEHEELPFMVTNTSEKKYLKNIDPKTYDVLYDIYKPSVEKAKEVIGDKIKFWRDYGVK